MYTSLNPAMEFSAAAHATALIKSSFDKCTHCIGIAAVADHFFVAVSSITVSLLVSKCEL